MLLTNRYVFNVNSINKPPSFSVPVRPQNQVITTHHSFSHLPRFLVKGPVLEAVAALPAHLIFNILVFIPELHRNTVISEGK